MDGSMDRRTAVFSVQSNAQYSILMDQPDLRNDNWTMKKRVQISKHSSHYI